MGANAVGAKARTPAIFPLLLNGGAGRPGALCRQAHVLARGRGLQQGDHLLGGRAAYDAAASAPECRRGRPGAMKGGCICSPDSYSTQGRKVGHIGERCDGACIGGRVAAQGSGDCGVGIHLRGASHRGRRGTRGRHLRALFSEPAAQPSAQVALRERQRHLRRRRRWRRSIRRAILRPILPYGLDGERLTAFFGENPRLQPTCRRLCRGSLRWGIDRCKERGRADDPDRLKPVGKLGSQDLAQRSTNSSGLVLVDSTTSIWAYHVSNTAETSGVQCRTPSLTERRVIGPRLRERLRRSVAHPRVQIGHGNAHDARQ
mmetsp:Transcript_92750/g.265960  ORF Transcript_92750/g.265960 Transcript_92750/m.265960 type:complete len:317 (-) Transcript_92750:591-1541(-)